MTSLFVECQNGLFTGHPICWETIWPFNMMSLLVMSKMVSWKKTRFSVSVDRTKWSVYMMSLLLIVKMAHTLHIPFVHSHEGLFSLTPNTLHLLSFCFFLVLWNIFYVTVLVTLWLLRYLQIIFITKVWNWKFMTSLYCLIFTQVIMLFFYVCIYLDILFCIYNKSFIIRIKCIQIFCL